MQGYIQIIRIGLIFTPFIIAGGTVPFLISSYHKFGHITIKRWLLVMSFIFYLFMVYCFVVLPLPTLEEVAQMTTPYTQTEPFYFIKLFFQKSGISLSNTATYLTAFKTTYFLEPVLNIIFFIPFGIYLRYYFEKPFWQVFLYAFALSLFLECTQLSALYGIYPRPYRIFDVDDLITNTFGGVLGFVIAPLITWWLPKKQDILKQSYERGETVSLTRRVVAVLLDWFIINFLQVAGTIAALILDIALPTANLIFSTMHYILIIFLYFIVLPYMTDGRTIGKWIVQIAVFSENHGRISFKQLVIREGLLYGIFVPAVIYLGRYDYMKILDSPSEIIKLLIPVGIALVFVANIIHVTLQHKHTFLYEKAAKTIEVSTIVIPE